MRVAISGIGGFLGSYLKKYLMDKGHEVLPIVRSSKDPSLQEILWNPEEEKIDISLLESVDVVVNFAGESILGYWSDIKKKRLVDSRIQTTKTIKKALEKMSSPFKLWINASAVGFYGPICEYADEKSPKGKGFIADLCADWEAASFNDKARTIQLRIGLVLSPKGGMLQKMLWPFRLGLGGLMGPGSSYMSWVALEEIASIIDFCIQQQSLSGPLNAVSPHPVTQREMVDLLKEFLHRPAFMDIPETPLKWILGDLAKEILLSDQRVYPKKLLDSGYPFVFSDLKSAFAAQFSYA